MKKKLFILISILLIILSGILVYFLFSKEEVEKLSSPRKEVGKRYEELILLAEEFNQKHISLEEKMKDLFYTKVNKNIESLYQILDEYDEIVIKITEKKNRLDYVCNHYYLDSDAVNKCNSYMEIYTNATDVFSQDVIGFNNYIKSYNKWASGESKYEEVKLFTSKTKIKEA